MDLYGRFSTAVKIVSKIKPINLEKRLHIYDGFEPDDYSLSMSLSETYPNLEFTFSEIVNQPFKKLENILDKESFEQIAALQKIKNPNTEWEHFVGSENLSLYYFIRESKLILVCFGEFQPARYKVHLEGIWQMN